MSIVAQPGHPMGQRPRNAESVGFFRIAGTLLRDPHRALTQIVESSDGRITRVNLGLFRPYLVTRPEHVAHVLRDNADNYPREGLMWKPMSRLVGHGIGGEGAAHAEARRALQPAFAARHITQIFDAWAPVITEAVSDLVRRGSSGQVLDSYTEMTRIIHRAVSRIFFGGAISVDDAEEVGEAVRTATTSFLARLALPWAPSWVPLPGDRRFRRSVNTVDKAVLPLVEQVRQGDADLGIASMLAQKGRSDQQIRDELVAVLLAASESTAVALSWLWVVLARHPEMAERLHAEIDEVVGTGTTPTLQQMHDLTYTKMLLEELLRVYSVGWIIPRTAREDDVIDGVRIKGGSIVAISPYLSHRVPEVWPDPERFDPERFSEAAVEERRARYPKMFPYLGFGAGHHACLGQQFFFLEASLVLTTLLQRCRPTLHQRPGAAPIKPRVSLALIPNQDVEIVLKPRD